MSGSKSGSESGSESELVSGSEQRNCTCVYYRLNTHDRHTLRGIPGWHHVLSTRQWAWTNRREREFRDLNQPLKYIQTRHIIQRPVQNSLRKGKSTYYEIGRILIEALMSRWTIRLEKAKGFILDSCPIPRRLNRLESGACLEITFWKNVAMRTS